MRIPTVRVKHPTLGFVTINASDFDAERHELHAEQAEEFDPSHLPISGISSRLDPAVRDAAAALGLRMTAFRRRIAGLSFADLAPAEQVQVLVEMEAELVAAESDYEVDQREREASKAQQQAQARAGAAPAYDGHSAPSEPPAPVSEPLRLAKGPRGLWYVMRGDARIGKGHGDEAAAVAALAAMQAEPV